MGTEIPTHSASRGRLIMRKKRNIVLITATQVLAALLLIAAGLMAQQTTESQAAKKMVPDNPSEHTPPAQPIPYSHKTHLAAGLECKECHTNPEPGRLMTFPATSKCMQCHVTIAKNKPSIQKLAEFSKSQKSIPWVRVYTVLQGVAWTHRTHLQAGVKCETCHGQVAEMDAMSEATSVITMYSCLNCHELNHAKTACDTCHKN
jgi:Cytochrome c7 and related cytochrome c/Cytochrome c3